MKKQVIECVEELVVQQKEKLLQCGRAFIPNLTFDDVLQPNDYPELDNNPHFRYEEGILAGIQSVQSAVFALFNER